METTAIYDEKTDELIVNTTTPLAQKYWITNGAIHAKHCVVFAQLMVKGTSQDISLFSEISFRILKVVQYQMSYLGQYLTV